MTAENERIAALEAALRELVDAVEKHGGTTSELGHRFLMGSLAHAFINARALVPADKGATS